MGVGRFDAPPKAAPEIELPSGVEAEPVVTERCIDVSADKARKIRDRLGVFAELNCADGTDPLAHLWKERTRGEAHGRTRLVHPQARDFERRVGSVGRFDECFENRIAEGSPPGGGLGARIAHALVVLGDPCVGDV